LSDPYYNAAASTDDSVRNVWQTINLSTYSPPASTTFAIVKFYTSAKESSGSWIYWKPYGAGDPVSPVVDAQAQSNNGNDDSDSGVAWVPYSASSPNFQVKYQYEGSAPWAVRMVLEGWVIGSGGGGSGSGGNGLTYVGQVGCTSGTCGYAVGTIFKCNAGETIMTMTGGGWAGQGCLVRNQNTASVDAIVIQGGASCQYACYKPGGGGGSSSAPDFETIRAVAVSNNYNIPHGFGSMPQRVEVYYCRNSDPTCAGTNYKIFSERWTAADHGAQVGFDSTYVRIHIGGNSVYLEPEFDGGAGTETSGYYRILAWKNGGASAGAPTFLGNFSGGYVNAGVTVISTTCTAGNVYTIYDTGRAVYDLCICRSANQLACFPG
jgi:hypothetical protein